MSVHKEAWGNTKKELKKEFSDIGINLLFIDDFVGLFNKHLEIARKRAKEYLEQEKILDMHPDAVYGRKWQRNKEIKDE